MLDHKPFRRLICGATGNLGERKQRDYLVKWGVSFEDLTLAAR